MDFFVIAFQNIKAFFIDLQATIFGLLMSIFGYFLPIKDLVHLVIFFFIIEMILGYFAAKSRGAIEKKKVMFSLTIVYEKTIPRMFITVLILIMLFLWDNINKQHWVPTYTLMGWFFTGLLILKSMRSAYAITKWIGFKYAAIILTKKMQNEIDGFESDDNQQKN